MNKRLYKTLSLVLCLGLSVVFFTQVYGDMSLVLAEEGANFNLQEEPTLLATGKPTVLKVTVTKVELWNGSAWVTLFSGSAQLDLVGTGTFPGISNLDLPGGTYSKIRVTFSNSFTLAGSLVHLAATFYTTATTINDDAAIVAGIISPALESTIKIPNWGNLGDPVVQTYDITPFTVTNETDYQPTLKFNVDNSLELWGIPPEVRVQVRAYYYYFILNNPIVSIV